MERELTMERTRVGLDFASQLGRKGGRKRQMTDSKIECAKKLLAKGFPANVGEQHGGVRANTLMMGPGIRSVLTKSAKVFPIYGGDG